MRAIRPAGLVVLAALTGIAGWAGYRSARRVPPGPPLAPSGPNAELPLVEFREVRSGPGGETGTLLTIDRSGVATLQTLPLSPGSKTTRIYLGCNAFAALPEERRYELDELRSSYGSEHADDRSEVSVVSRFEGRERKVV